ncbi:hypothetical protein Ahy_B08g092043 [Arachis hypogaea]|uniref:Aminotransferase-like plant mobile domain-containing protein n=1 Tax=Arachis hypogaea TaxID=3818 RepID=A0A444Y387_ARAHY|nr:hypothetical protein Ahy_B08g092043 [Arachis hypogaea]
MRADPTGSSPFATTTCNYLLSWDPYNPIKTGFDHVSHIGVTQCQSTMVNSLTERWHPNTHMFYLLVSECAVTLEDITVILGLPPIGLPVIGVTMSSYNALEAECLHQFGVAHRKVDCTKSFIKLIWFRNLKDRLALTGEIGIQKYVKYHIMLLFETILFGDTSRIVSLKTRYTDSKQDVPKGRIPKSLLFVDWAGMGNRKLLQALDLILREITTESVLIGIINCSLLLILRGLQFVKEANGVDRIELDMILEHIHQHSVVWSAAVSLILDGMEPIGFGDSLGIPHQEWDLEKAHREVLTGPKNLDWSTTDSFWAMQWTNRYGHIAELLVQLQHPL